MNTAEIKNRLKVSATKEGPVLKQKILTTLLLSAATIVVNTILGKGKK